MRPGAIALLRVLALESALLIGYLVVPIGSRAWVTGLVVGAGTVVLSVALTTRKGRALLTSDQPILDAAITISWLLVLLVVGFSSVYFAMASHSGDIPGIETRLDAMYFTVTTLATVGFGDIVPRSQAARSIVTVQMIFDLTFLAIALRLLGVVVRRREGETSGQSG